MKTDPLQLSKAVKRQDKQQHGFSIHCKYQFKQAPYIYQKAVKRQDRQQHGFSIHCKYQFKFSFTEE